jgi:hypothetical protein
VTTTATATAAATSSPTATATATGIAAAAITNGFVENGDLGAQRIDRLRHALHRR